VKPILGRRSTSPGSARAESRANGEYAYHLILLAENRCGYRNLSGSLPRPRGFYYRPRVRQGAAAEILEGLIATSACLQASPVLDGTEASEGARGAEEYNRSPRRRFYLEIQDNASDQERMNRFSSRWRADRTLW